MARAPRKTCASNIYHVFARGVGRQIIFEDNRDRQTYLGIFSKLASERSCTILAWCLMDNHVHLLFRADLREISELIKSAHSTYSLAFNVRHDRVGHLFQGRFGSEPVDSDAYLMTVVRYIHQNPEVAGLGKTTTYPWSSFHEYISPPGIADTAFVLSVFGGTDAFVRFHEHSDASAPCVDENRGRRLLDPESARTAANEAIAPATVEDVIRMPRNERNAALSKMRKAHLSVRQIERLTGVSRGIIARNT